jgi:hypothetical protein
VLLYFHGGAFVEYHSSWPPALAPPVHCSGCGQRGRRGHLRRQPRCDGGCRRRDTATELLKHRLRWDKRRAARISNEAVGGAAANGTSRSAGVATPVVSGLAQGSGEYFTKISVGTHATPALMDLEGGWVAWQLTGLLAPATGVQPDADLAVHLSLLSLRGPRASGFGCSPTRMGRKLGATRMQNASGAYPTSPHDAWTWSSSDGPRPPEA